MSHSAEDLQLDPQRAATTAAKRRLSSMACGATVKGRADHLVRVWKNRAFKSR